MGAGIAQVALEAGNEVILHDVDPEAVERATARIADGLGRRAAKLGLDADTIEGWADGRMSRLRHSPTLDGIAAEADLVIEAVIEDLALKSAVFRTLDAESDARTILATNTSALSVGAIAEATADPERVIGLHFFNPVSLMSLVEVVPTPETSDDVIDRATAIVRSWGKTPIRSADRPGFIVNRVNRPFTLEALRMLEEAVATVDSIDTAVRGAGYPMGPFELMDLAGLDVNLAAAEGVWAGLGRPDRLRPSPIQDRLVASGHLGRKSGRGFYRYDDGRRGTVDEAFATSHPEPVLAAGTIVGRIEAAIASEARLAVDERVASEADIDAAMRLGAGHPKGPFEKGSSA